MPKYIFLKTESIRGIIKTTFASCPSADPGINHRALTELIRGSCAGRGDIEASIGPERAMVVGSPSSSDFVQIDIMELKDEGCWQAADLTDVRHWLLQRTLRS